MALWINQLVLVPWLEKQSVLIVVEYILPDQCFSDPSV